MNTKQLLAFSLSLLTTTTALTIPSVPSQAQSISCAVSDFGPSGGTGGASGRFQLPNTSRIRSLVIRAAGTVVGGIRINHVSNTGQSSSFTFGSLAITPARTDTINFASDERITGISGRYGTFAGGGTFVSTITIQTNLRRYGPFGGSSLPANFGAPYSYPVPSSYNFAGFTFRSGSFIDAIGLGIRRNNCNS